VDAAAYPKQTLRVPIPEDGESAIVHVAFELVQDPIYHVEPSLDAFDVYVDVEISLVEFFTGCRRELALWAGAAGAAGAPWAFDIPPMPELETPLSWPGRGVRGRGTLYVSIYVRLPRNREHWAELDAPERALFLKSLESVTGPRVPEECKTKGI
jgi:DnaJ-class molecular chaperone